MQKQLTSEVQQSFNDAMMGAIDAMLDSLSSPIRELGNVPAVTINDRKAARLMLAFGIGAILKEYVHE